MVERNAGNGGSKKPRKEWKSSKKENSDDFDMMSDSEMLRIQGLVRCRICDEPFPDELDNCPYCGSLHPHLIQNT